jgi:DnaJ-domain-containing protein 1
MGILDRLEDVIKSYLNDEEEPLIGKPFSRRQQRHVNPDLDAAYEELNDFLNRDSASARASFDARAEQSRASRPTDFRATRPSPVPESLRPDFAELGVPFGTSAEDCKVAYKKLLKIHHPDRHAGHAENMRKATEKSSRINAAYDRINKWRETGLG